MLLRTMLALLALISGPAMAAPKGAAVREERSFTIDGSKEVWRLIWRGAPTDSNSCGPVDRDMAMTCPCSGVAYAQVGDLVLERKRVGTPTERMSLSPLFAGTELPLDNKGPAAMLVRWPARSSDGERALTPAAIRARPPVPIMRLRDYNHDGMASEFLLQVDTLPCGKHLLVAVGITRDNPHLHALASASHPERPLALYEWEWNALARNVRPVRVMDWQCGDHGSEDETIVLLRTEHGHIHATRVTSTCPTYVTDANGKLRDGPTFRKKELKREIM